LQKIRISNGKEEKKHGKNTKIRKYPRYTKNDIYMYVSCDTYKIHISNGKEKNKQKSYARVPN